MLLDPRCKKTSGVLSGDCSPRRSLGKLLLGTLLMWSLLCRSVNAEPPRELKAPEVIEATKTVRSYTELGLSPEFVVEGDKIFDGQILAADVLVFKPGSRLIFSGAGGDRREKYIVARTIRVLPGTPVPIISWDRDLDVGRVPRVILMGKAAPGPAGGGEGADGGSGGDGQTGNPGYPGRSAPSIYMFLNKLVGGPIHVDLRGQDGGIGGEGQVGGDGGIGRSGQSAVSGVLDCRLTSGKGGNGGKGGRGGNGGDGGRGGSGGTFILLSTKAGIEAAKGSFVVDVSPGMGGEPGKEGQGGSGGLPGPGGSGNGFCGAGQPGVTGLQGDSGTPGQLGKEGAPGDFVVTILTDIQLNRALGI